MIDLPEPARKEILRLVKIHAPEHEILAFGSRLTGQNHEASDLDIALRHPKRPEQRLASLAALREAFSLSNIPFLIDLHDWAALPDAFRKEIEERHVTL